MRILPISSFFLYLVTLLVVAERAQGAETTPAKFYRGINLNGPAVVIDGNPWEPGDAQNLRCNGGSFENQKVPLKPPTDADRSRMIRSSRWGRPIDVELLNVPAGSYQVYLYVWEDNDSTTYSISLNGRKVLNQYASGSAGTWKKLGPWRTTVSDHVIRISAQGGDANLSGIEVWAGEGELPKPPTAAGFNLQPTAEELAFFESKIRPVLINRCYKCHSQEKDKQGGSLLLDSRAGILQGGDTGPTIVPGDPEASLLVRAIRHADPDLKMPPGKKLSDLEIADLEKWVRLRAPDPRAEDTAAALKAKTAIDWNKARDFWSLKPLVAPAIPKVRDASWPRGDIDRFVLARLEAAGLRPAPDAAKSVWLRRVTYDLTGLPPTPEALATFEADDSADAYAQVVDRLLASPQYGERWGRHWLDVVRYADTAGDNSDFPIPQMYRYRNWVIDAFNRDLPYDQFVREQLAGDLLGGSSTEEAKQRLIATGYLANTRRFGSRVDDYPWHLTIEDTIDNLGRTFLATTINCARCHNHKFDPVTNEDYYGLYGIFQSTRYPWPGIELEQHQRDLVPLIPAADAERLLGEHRKQQAELDARVKQLEKERDKAKDQERKSLDKQVEDAKKKAQRHARTPLPFEQAYAVADKPLAEDAYLQQKGDPAKPGPLVARHFLTVLNGARLAQEDKSSGRLQLANWIVDPKNPLTARVMVNRLWLHHFGKGIVATPNDFGRQGQKPTHPELLDHLATQFMASGWSIKAMHRQIVLSRTYRQSSQRSDEAAEKDPANELLAGYSRRRLDAESLRDTLLTLGGHLDSSPGGSHPFPPQTDWNYTQHYPFKAIYETNKRSVYLMTQRIQRHPYLAIFDGPDSAASTAQRLTSTTPLQALYLLNDPFVHAQATGLAERLLSARTQDVERLERAYLLMFGRKPTSEEWEASREFLAAVRDRLRLGRIAEDQLELQSWRALLLAMLRLNEFVYLD